MLRVARPNAGFMESRNRLAFAAQILLIGTIETLLLVSPEILETTGVVASQRSLDIWESRLISQLVTKPVRKQTNMVVKTLLWALAFKAIRPELKIR